MSKQITKATEELGAATKESDKRAAALQSAKAVLDAVEPDEARAWERADSEHRRAAAAARRAGERVEAARAQLAELERAAKVAALETAEGTALGWRAALSPDVAELVAVYRTVQAIEARIVAKMADRNAAARAAAALRAELGLPASPNLAHVHPSDAGELVQRSIGAEPPTAKDSVGALGWLAGAQPGRGRAAA